VCVCVLCVLETKMNSCSISMIVFLAHLMYSVETLDDFRHSGMLCGLHN